MPKTTKAKTARRAPRKATGGGSLSASTPVPETLKAESRLAPSVAAADDDGWPVGVVIIAALVLGLVVLHYLRRD